MPPGEPTPDFYVLFSLNSSPFLRLNVYRDEYTGFEETKIWNDLIAIGNGHSVYLYDYVKKMTTEIKLESYFGNFYFDNSILFICTADEVIAVNDHPRVIWQTTNLGIDGVYLYKVDKEKVYGQGEWDPPGGWKPFILDRKTGDVLKVNT